MNVLLSDWRGPRMMAFRLGKFCFEWGRWHYQIDKYGCVIMDWVWDKDDQKTEL